MREHLYRKLARPLCRGVGMAVACALVGPAPVAAQDALVSFEVLAPRLALELADQTMQACEAKGFQVAVAVVDRFGVLQALVRNRFAGPHTPDTAARKAWTAVSFRAETTELARITAGDPVFSGARSITNALMLGGGVPVEARGQLVGAVGVSGAPSGEEDAACGKDGIAAIADKLPF